MTAQTNIVQPPRFATWLVNLFISAQGESIVGDLFEEFCLLASRSGVAFARRWYWRQTVKTIGHLIVAGFRGAPASITAIVIAGFFLHGFVLRLPEKLLSALTDRYLAFWSTHFEAYVWLLNGISVELIVASMFVGCMVALAAKGREMIAATMLALVFGVLIGSAWVWIGTHGPISAAWMLWSCSDPVAILVGAAMVRSRRSAAKPLPSSA